MQPKDNVRTKEKNKTTDHERKLRKSLEPVGFLKLDEHKKLFPQKSS